MLKAAAMKGPERKTQIAQRFSIHVSIASHRMIAWIGERRRLACFWGARAGSLQLSALAEIEKSCQ
jgi:hypothetical protein